MNEMQDEIEELVMKSAHIFNGAYATSRTEHFTRFYLSPVYYQIHMMTRTKFTLSAHSHDYYHLIYVMDGRVEVKVGGKEFTLNKYDMFIAPARALHSLSSDTGYTQLGINFYPVESMKSVFSHPAALVLPEIMTYAERAASLDPGNRFYDEQLIALCDLVVSTTAAGMSSDLDPQKRRMLEYIESSIGGEFSLPMMAEKFYISESSLERKCREFFGTGVLALRNRKRFERACELLANSDHSVRTISLELGFAESSNFSAFFKKYSGSSPTDYRNRFFE